jgi:type I restriction enzyme S subunit
MMVDSKLDAEERRRDALDALFKSLLHHLMTGKVRVCSVEN